jgi:hypothetical protein
MSIEKRIENLEKSARMRIPVKSATIKLEQGLCGGSDEEIV